MSNIVTDFYTGRHVFVTGFTGFLGKVLVEKLLRSCPNVDTIYVLIRMKRNVDVAERLNKVISSQIFDIIRDKDANILKKIIAVKGDITELGLGLSSFDSQLLSEKVEIVFHCAATVNFVEPISEAVKKNLGGTMEVVKFCKTMEKLMSLVYVSTAYSNCFKNEVKEELYEANQTYKDVLSMVEILDEESLTMLTPRLLGSHPNTYTFTKNLAEQFLSEEAVGSIPTTIVRPSIVISSLKEPYPGWIDGQTGMTKYYIGIAKGMIRVCLGNTSTIADIIPVDIVMNLCIVAAWHRTTIDRKNEIPIYNSVLGNSKQLTWGYLSEFVANYTSSEMPLSDIYQIPKCFMTHHIWLNKLLTFYKHWIPSYIMDIAAVLTGRKPQMLKGCQKMDQLISQCAFFTTRQWVFHKTNTTNLWHSLPKEVQEVFYFSLQAIDWDSHLKNYIVGCRKYIMKDPLSTVTRARLQIKKMTRNQRIRRFILLIAFGMMIARRNPLMMDRVYRMIFRILSFIPPLNRI